MGDTILKLREVTEENRRCIVHVEIRLVVRGYKFELCTHRVQSSEINECTTKLFL